VIWHWTYKRKTNSMYTFVNDLFHLSYPRHVAKKYLFIIRKSSAATVFDHAESVLKLYVKVKVNRSHYRPGVAQRVPGSYGSQIT